MPRIDPYEQVDEPPLECPGCGLSELELLACPHCGFDNYCPQCRMCTACDADPVSNRALYQLGYKDAKEQHDRSWIGRVYYQQGMMDYLLDNPWEIVKRKKIWYPYRGQPVIWRSRYIGTHPAKVVQPWVGLRPRPAIPGTSLPPIPESCLI